MYAMATALVAPTSSNTAPKSQVMRLKNVAPTMRLVLMIRWRRRLNGSSGHQYVIMTSRQTNASSGIVVSMFRPKHRRAMLTMMLSEGKLLRTLPSVLSPKVTKPASAMIRHASIDTPVE